MRVALYKKAETRQEVHDKINDRGKRMHKKAKWSGLLSGMCAVAFSAGAYTANTVRAQAQDTPTLWTGFAIDATAVRTASPTGLRFRTVAERLTPTMKKYNPDAEYYTTLTFTATNGQSYSTKVETTVWRLDESGWNTVLLEIPKSDYATQITAQSFIKLNGKETAFYKTEPVTVSISQTAAAAVSYGATSTYVQEYFGDIVTGVTLDKQSVTLEQGQTLSLTATTSPSGYQSKWTTSDASVVTVDNKGNVKAKATGSAVITAQINGHTAVCGVTVVDRDESITAFASSVSLSSGIVSSPNRKITIPGTWLNGIFADARIDAVSFSVTSDKAMNLSTDFGYEISLSKNAAKSITLTRTMHDAWEASGASDLSLTSDLSNWSSASISFSNFKKVWAIEESQALSANEVAALEGFMPNYMYNSYQFDFFGYSALTDGYYTDENGQTHFGGEDFRNVYRIEEYKEAGMTILFPQSSCAIEWNEDNFNFSTSKLKEVMDMSMQAGLDRVIVADYRLNVLVKEESLIGEGKQFATEAELDAHMKTLMSQYVKHPAFYGVQLRDEPKYTMLESFGQLYRSIKRCFPDSYIQCNLFPPVGGTVGSLFPTPSETTKAKYTALGLDSMHAERFAAYEEYLKMYLDYTGADYIMYDQYPFTDYGMYECFVGGMQVAANVCAERGVELKFVSQTMTMQGADTADNQRIMTEADLRYLNNMALGFGVKQLAYFTYVTRDNNFYSDGTLAEKFLDGGSFINRNGEKTDIYYYMREILAENQAFASTILSFDYQTSATYIASGNAYGVTNAVSTSKGSFAKISDVSVNTESALVTQLFDKYNSRYMYMLQNITDAQYSALQTVKVTFNEDYEYAIVWKNGEKQVVRLQNNEYVAKLQAGEAVYVIPFNAEETEQDDGFVVDTANRDNGVWFPGSSLGETNYDGDKSNGEFIIDTAKKDNGAWFPGSDFGTSPWE